MKICASLLKDRMVVEVHTLFDSSKIPRTNLQAFVVDPSETVLHRVEFLNLQQND